NTWLHRPMLHTFKKVLANSEPSTYGGKADIAAAVPTTIRAPLLFHILMWALNQGCGAAFWICSSVRPSGLKRPSSQARCVQWGVPPAATPQSHRAAVGFF